MQPKFKIGDKVMTQKSNGLFIIGTVCEINQRERMQKKWVEYRINFKYPDGSDFESPSINEGNVIRYGE